MLYCDIHDMISLLNGLENEARPTRSFKNWRRSLNKNAENIPDENKREWFGIGISPSIMNALADSQKELSVKDVSGILEIQKTASAESVVEAVLDGVPVDAIRQLAEHHVSVKVMKHFKEMNIELELWDELYKKAEKQLKEPGEWKKILSCLALYSKVYYYDASKDHDDENRRAVEWMLKGIVNPCDAIRLDECGISPEDITDDLLSNDVDVLCSWKNEVGHLPKKGNFSDSFVLKNKICLEHAKILRSLDDE